MDTKYNLKIKGSDNKYATYGNITPGEKGPRCGLRVTPELRALMAGKQDGEWINFLMFPDDRQVKPNPYPTRSVADEEIGF